MPSRKYVWTLTLSIYLRCHLNTQWVLSRWTQYLQKQYLICFNLCLLLEWRLVHAMISGPDIEVWFWTYLHLWMSFWITRAIPSCAWICKIGLELTILRDSELIIHSSHEYEPLYNCMPRYLNPWTIPSDSELQCAPNIFRDIPLDTHHCSLWKKNCIRLILQ